MGSWLIAHHSLLINVEWLKGIVIEAEVHSSLRAFLRSQGRSIPPWHHHLTMARLVARALRLGRGALIQTGTTRGSYRLSYLAPALLWSKPVILVAPSAIHSVLVERLIPQLQHLATTPKEIQLGDRFPDDPQFQGLLIVDPASWLSDRLNTQGRFPPHIPTLIDGADDLEEWTRHQLTTDLLPGDWDELLAACPTSLSDRIRDVRVQLTKSVFQHPPNPYDRYLIDLPDQDALRGLFEGLETLPPRWQNFWHHWQKSGQLMWAAIARSQGQFSLSIAPVEVATSLQSVWTQQPVVIMGSALDLDAEAKVYRTQLGLGDMTCVKFDPARQNEPIQLYLPDRFPMPNTPQFQNAFLLQVRTLIYSCREYQPVVILVGDVPLRAQVAAILAGEFGSRVQVETAKLEDNSILVTGWEFWRQHQSIRPQLLAIATLPIPSLENPLVAGRVAYYKQQHRDWFRLYLLPVALREMQRAIAPIRESQGVVALFDSRVNHRSYGSLILSSISPFSRTNYLDPTWFG